MSQSLTKMHSTRQQQSGHLAGDPVDPSTQRVMLSTPGVNSGLFLEHLKHPVVRRDWCRAEYATRWSYGRRFCHRAMMVLACWELRVCPVSFLSPTKYSARLSTLSIPGMLRSSTASCCCGAAWVKAGGSEGLAAGVVAREAGTMEK